MEWRQGGWRGVTAVPRGRDAEAVLEAVTAGWKGQVQEVVRSQSAGFGPEETPKGHQGRRIQGHSGFWCDHQAEELSIAG